MATNYTDLAVALNKVFAGPMGDLIARSNPVLRTMTKRGLNADRIRWRMKMGTNHAPSLIQDGQPVVMPTGLGPNFATAELDWTTQASFFSIPKRLLAQFQSDPELFGGSIQQELQDAAKDLADKLANLLFSFNPANDLVGIPSIINDANTYAGVDRTLAANALFRSVIYDPSVASAPAPLSTSLFNTSDREFFKANREGWLDSGNFSIVTTNDLYTKYRQLFTNIDISSLSTAHFVNAMNTTNSLGQTTAAYAGVPLMRTAEIADAPLAGDLAASQRAYILDYSKVGMAFLDSTQDSRIHQLDATRAPVIDGIPVQIEILGNRGELIEGYVKTWVNTYCTDPRRAGMVIKNIAK